MSGITSDSRSYYADLIDTHEKFLEQNIHHLGRVIRPRQFYSWLRKNGVFTVDDQEEVENKFCTTVMKAGHLIDIIKTRGVNGFIAFMEVIEYTLPDVFTELTKKRPREPTSDFYPVVTCRASGRFMSRRARQLAATSADMLTQAGELTSSLMALLANKKEELNQLHQLMNRLKVEQEQTEEDNAMLYEQLQHARNYCEEKTAEIEMLQKLSQQLKDELVHERELSAKLRSEKDSLATRCHQLMVAPVLLASHGKSQTEAISMVLKPAASIGASTAKPPAVAKKPSAVSCKAKMADVDGSVSLPQDYWENTLKAQISKLMEDKRELYQENLELQNKVKQLESDCCTLQENSNGFLLNYGQMKIERDQIQSTCEELEKKYNEEQTRNEKLTAECRKYEEQFRKMEDTICVLRKELEQRTSVSMRSSQQPIKTVTSSPRPTELPGRSDSLSSVSPGLPSIATGLRSTNFVWASLGQSADSDQKSPDDRSKLPADTNSCKPTTETAQASDAVPTIRRRGIPKSNTPQRRVAITGRQDSGLLSKPVVVYAPPNVQSELLDYLRPLFESCPYETVDCSDRYTYQSSENTDVVHSVQGQGSTCQLLTVNAVRNCCEKAKVAVLLPPISLTSILLLKKHNLEPIVLLVKVIEDPDLSPITAIEESLEKMNLLVREFICVPSSDASDFEKLADYVKHAISSLTLKHQFLLSSCDFLFT